MDLQETATEQIREIAGQVRLLAALLRPIPDLPDVDRGLFERALLTVAADLDRVAHRTEQGCHRPTGRWEGTRQ